MVNFFDKLYSSIVGENRLLTRIKFYSALRFITRTFFNFIAPPYFLLTRKNKNFALNPSQNKEGRLIISLTTFPARINKVWLVIETLLRQTHKPDKIILWLSKDQFFSVNILPKNLLKQRSRGLEIRLMEGDLKSHKKYYYTLKEYPQDYMVLADDDIFYRSTMIENLFKYSSRYPESIISQYSQRIRWVDGEVSSYRHWSVVNQEEIESLNCFFCSGGGTLFPPRSLDEDVLNMPLCMSLTPTADDIWLNTMCRLKGTKITKTELVSFFLPVIYLKNVTLSTRNLDEGLNDVQLKAVRAYYKNVRIIDPFQNLHTICN